MKHTVSALALSALLAVPTLANAVVISANYTVNVNGSDPGLVVNQHEIAANPFTYDLAVGDSVTFDLFKIWTNESDVGSDDKVPQAISVDFSFLLPSIFGGSLGGVTVGGTWGWFDATQWGEVRWGDPLELTYGAANDGLIIIDLSDEKFNEGLFGLHEGKKHGAKVEATITLVREASVPVPEPASLALLGLGMLGLGLRRRKQ